jgi:hypothetical protein
VVSGSKRYDGQVRNHLEVANVPATDCVAVVQSGRTDEQIREGNHFSDSSRVGSTFAAICAISLLKLSTGIAAKTSSR